MVSTRTVTREVTNVSDASETYNAELVLPPGIDVQVTPASLTVSPGQSATYDVTFTFVSGLIDYYRFGSLTWVSDDHSVRSVLSVRPLSIDAPYENFWSGVDGNKSFPVDFGYTGSYFPAVHDLHLPDKAPGFVDNDPNKTFTLRSRDGVTLVTYDVPADQAFLRFATFDEHTDGQDDLDMYVYYCDPKEFLCTDQNNNVFIDNFSKIGQSGGATSDEQVDVLSPHEGIYAVFIHGFATEDLNGTNYKLLAWQFGMDDSPGNMTVTGPRPRFVNAGEPQDVTVNWSGLAPNEIYLGGILHKTPDELVSLTVINIKN
jgi:hypothetical protein